MNITREQMLEFFDGILCRLDYEYTRDTPRFKEMTAAIESLIESSGENYGSPSMESGENLSGPTPVGSPEMVRTGCATQPLQPSPAHLPAEVPLEAVLPKAVEEAVGRIAQAIGEAFLWRWNNRCVPITANASRDEDVAALAVIRAALTKP